jgi:hypothetical protein
LFVIQLSAIAELELVKDELQGANPLIFVYGIHGFGPNSVQTKSICEKMFCFVLIMLIGYEVKWTLTGSYGPGNVFDDA